MLSPHQSHYFSKRRLMTWARSRKILNMKPWRVRNELFVTSNSKREGLEYTSYSVKKSGDEEANSVERRYSEFLWLYTKLQISYPGATVPPIPGKKMFGKTNRKVVECRQRGLEEFINRVIRHPVLSMAPFVLPFIYEEDIATAKVICEQYMSNDKAAPSRAISWKMTSSQKRSSIKEKYTATNDRKMRFVVSAINTHLSQLHRLLRVSKHWLSAHKDSCRGASSLRRALIPLENALVNPPACHPTGESAVATEIRPDEEKIGEVGDCPSGREYDPRENMAGAVAVQACLMRQDWSETEAMQKQEHTVVTQFAAHITRLASTHAQLCLSLELQLIEPLTFMIKHLQGMLSSWSTYKDIRDFYLAEISALTDKKAQYDSILATTPHKPAVAAKQLEKLQNSFRATSKAEDVFKLAFRHAMDEWKMFIGTNDASVQHLQRTTSPPISPPTPPAHAPTDDCKTDEEDMDIRTAGVAGVVSPAPLELDDGTTSKYKADHTDTYTTNDTVSDLMEDRTRDLASPLGNGINVPNDDAHMSLSCRGSNLGSRHYDLQQVLLALALSNLEFYQKQGESLLLMRDLILYP